MWIQNRSVFIRRCILEEIGGGVYYASMRVGFLEILPCFPDISPQIMEVAQDCSADSSRGCGVAHSNVVFWAALTENAVFSEVFDL